MENWWCTSIPIWNNCWMKENVTLFPLQDVVSTLANMRVSDCIYITWIIRLGMFLSCTQYLINKLWNISLIHTPFLVHIICVRMNSLILHTSKSKGRGSCYGILKLHQKLKISFNAFVGIVYQRDWESEISVVLEK